MSTNSPFTRRALSDDPPEDLEGLLERLKDLTDGPRAFFDVVARGSAAIGPLERLVRGPSTSVSQPRCLAAEALGAIGGSAAVEALTRALTDSSRRQLEPVLRLAEDAVVDAIASQLDRTPSQLVDDALLGALQARPHAACALALGHHHDHRSIQRLVECLHDDFCRGSAQAALLAIGTAASEALVGALLSPLQLHGLEGPSSVTGRAVAALLLGELGPQSAVQALTTALSDSEAEVREAAALALSRFVTPSPEVIKVLVESLGQEDWTRAEAPSQALVALGALAAEPLLAVVAREFTTAEQRRRWIRAVRTVAGLGHQHSLLTLRALATKQDIEFRRIAVAAIASAGETGNAVLATFLDDDDDGIRLLALRVLANRSPASASWVVNRLGDRNRQVRVEAQAAFRRWGAASLPAIESAARGQRTPSRHTWRFFSRLRVRRLRKELALVSLNLILGSVGSQKGRPR